MHFCVTVHRLSPCWGTFRLSAVFLGSITHTHSLSLSHHYLPVAAYEYLCPCKLYCEMTYTTLHIAVESLPLDLFEAQLPHHAASVTVMLLVVMLLKLSVMVLSVMVLSVMVLSVRFLSVMLLSAVPAAFRRAAFVQGNGP